MASTQKIKFGIVHNGNYNPFPKKSAHVVLLSGYPGLLHLEEEKGSAVRLIAFRDGKQHTVLDLPEAEFWKRTSNCDGTKISFIERDCRHGIILTCTNGSFEIEKVAIPSFQFVYPIQGIIPIVKWFHIVNDLKYVVASTYVLTSRRYEYQVFSDLSPIPLFTFPINDAYLCFVGDYLLVLRNLFGLPITIAIHRLKSNEAASIRSFDEDLMAFTSLENRWLIIVGRARVCIIDVLTMKFDVLTINFDTFNFAIGLGDMIRSRPKRSCCPTNDIVKCAACKRDNLFELYISTSYSSCRIYKAFLPIKGLVGNEESHCEQEPATDYFGSSIDSDPTYSITSSTAQEPADSSLTSVSGVDCTEQEPATDQPIRSVFFSELDHRNAALERENAEEKEKVTTMEERMAALEAMIAQLKK